MQKEKQEQQQLSFDKKRLDDAILRLDKILQNNMDLSLAILNKQLTKFKGEDNGEV